MNRPTTIRLDDEYRERLRKLGRLHASQTKAIYEALDLLWQRDGEQAERIAAIMVQPRKVIGLTD